MGNMKYVPVILGIFAALAGLATLIGWYTTST